MSRVSLCFPVTLRPRFGQRTGWFDYFGALHCVYWFFGRPLVREIDGVDTV